MSAAARIMNYDSFRSADSIGRMDTATRPITSWQLRTRALELGTRTLVMGVINLTPDSFSDGGSFARPEHAVKHALQLLEQGADVLDLGAESTRPGSQAGGDEPAVSAEEEQARLLPVLEGILKARPGAVVSVDTYKAATARAAIATGAEIINDVSGLCWDADMAALGAESRAGLVLMHTRGRPEEWRTQQQLAPAAVLAMVRDGLAASLALAQHAGIKPGAIVLDPGYGFGKRFGENFSLLKRQAELLRLGIRCLPESPASLFSVIPWLLCMGARRRPWMRAKTPASRLWSPPFCMALPSCACIPSPPRWKQRASPTPSSPPDEET